MLGRRGFTLIELLVVLTIVALLLTIAVPRYIDHVGRARETALRTDLKVMREAIDKFEGDQGRLPKDLDELVARRYLKAIPVDPITDKRDSWIVVSAAELDQELTASAGSGSGPTVVTTTSKDGTTSNATPVEGVADIRTGAQGKARDGTEFKDW
ncbi:MAG: prepilin-type N-terminal cleavage/methylation domain-containing protein [Burkholderiaceae bacterium]|nr:prepilin-type N-terminal cleavage/methylation domain-containing protein [Burkholderiaceae bacterium]